MENKYESTRGVDPVTQSSTIKTAATTTTKATTKTTSTSNPEEEELLEEEEEEAEEIVEVSSGRSASVTATAEKLPCPSIVPNPCLNKGTCMYLGHEITCNCANTFAGTFCTERVDFCSSQPCHNGGTCQNVGQYDGKCQCLPGYSGRFCEGKNNIFSKIQTQYNDE